MRSEMFPIFQVPVITIRVSEWSEKKELLIEKSKEVNLSHDFDKFVKTSYNLTVGDEMNVQNILSEELKVIEENIEGNVAVTQSWVERASKGMWHEIHNHGMYGLSCSLYLKYDKKEHTPIYFVSPFRNCFDGQLSLATLEDIDEGVLVVFPSSLDHFTRPNKSDKDRMCLSFNLQCIFQNND